MQLKLKKTLHAFLTAISFSLAGTNECGSEVVHSAHCKYMYTVYASALSRLSLSRSVMCVVFNRGTPDNWRHFRSQMASIELATPHPAHLSEVVEPTVITLRTRLRHSSRSSRSSQQQLQWATV